MTEEIDSTGIAVAEKAHMLNDNAAFKVDGKRNYEIIAVISAVRLCSPNGFFYFFFFQKQVFSEMRRKLIISFMTLIRESWFTPTLITESVKRMQTAVLEPKNPVDFQLFRKPYNQA